MSIPASSPKNAERSLFNLFRTSIRNQLAGITISMALIPVLVVSIFIGVFAISRIRATLQANALSQLEQVRTLKSEQLLAFFAEREANVKLNSQTQTTLDALTSFTDGFNAAGSNTVRSLYLGKPDSIDAGDGSPYSLAHRQFAPYLESLHSIFGFYDVFIINRNGQVVYSYAKEDDFGTNLINGAYADTKLAEAFQAALKLKAGETVLTDFAFYAPSAGAPAAFRAAPIYDASGQVAGVMAVQVPLDRITAIMQERTGLGETGETFLVGEDKLFRSESFFTPDSLLKVKVDTISSNAGLAGKTGSGPITDYRGLPAFAAWQPVEIGGLHWAFIAKIDQSEALATANQLTTFIATSVSVAGLIVLVLALFVAFTVSRSFVQPILELRDFATSAASGNLDITIASNRKDELGVLAQTFNTMTFSLRQAFEDVRRRTLAVQTSAEVSRRLSTATNPRQLALDVVEQVQSAFKYYHAHIYFLDETSGDMVMAGGTGEAGAAMLARGHKVLKGRGLVGRAAETNAPVLVTDVAQADNWLPNPLLPDTKSEIAIPISSGKQVLGVLDVQQNVINGLGEEDVELLQSLAGQVAISYLNARTFEESRAQAELESLVNTIGQKIQRATTVDDTLQTAIREIGLALGASRVSANIQAGFFEDNGKGG